VQNIYLFVFNRTGSARTAANAAGPEVHGPARKRCEGVFRGY
jgi:hypothetical protein